MEKIQGLQPIATSQTESLRSSFLKRPSNDKAEAEPQGWSWFYLFPWKQLNYPRLLSTSHHHFLFQLSNEEKIKNITHWTLFNYYNSSGGNESVPRPPPHPADVPRGSCWETAVGIVSSSALWKGSHCSEFFVVPSLIFPFWKSPWNLKCPSSRPCF